MHKLLMAMLAANVFVILYYIVVLATKATPSRSHLVGAGIGSIIAAAVIALSVG